MPRILIVEDEPDIALGLELDLRDEGYEVEVVGDGDTAIARGGAPGWDLILLDVMLPLRDGFEVCQRVRDNPALAGVKIVMLTAKGREVEVAKGLALGADLYITKPFATRELLASVERLLQKPQ